MAATTEYESDTYCRPVPAENLVYFAYPNGGYAGVREFYVESSTGQKDAAPVTSHVPKYVPGQISRMSVCSTEDTLVCLTDSDRSSLYVYKWFWNGQEKVQSSWSVWTFDLNAGATPIFGVRFIGPTAYMVIGRGTDLFLEKLGLEANPTEPGLSFLVHLDRRVNDSVLAGTYNAVADTTTVDFTFPVTGSLGIIQCVTIGDYNGFKVGQRLTPVSTTTFSATYRGNLIGVPAVYGFPYEMRYRFSEPVIREPSPTGGIVGVTNGRLQVRTFSVVYEKTGYFRVETTPLYRDTATVEFTGRQIGNSLNLIGQVAGRCGGWSTARAIRSRLISSMTARSPAGSSRRGGRDFTRHGRGNSEVDRQP
jgi:hypothetical protein